MPETETVVEEKTGEVEGAEAENTEAEGTETEETKTEETESKEEETVSMDRFKEMVDKVELLTKQAEVTAEQAAIAKANPIAAQQQVNQFDIFKEVGLDKDDDIPDVGQTKKIMAHYGSVFDRRLADIAFLQAHPDYAQIVGTVDEIASGKYAEPLAAAIKKNPALQSMIANSRDPRIAAYEVAKLQKESVTKPVVTKEAQDAIDEAVKIANKVLSPSNTKGGESLSEEGRYATMSDKDFLKIATEHGAFV